MEFLLRWQNYINIVLDKTTGMINSNIILVVFVLNR